MVILTASLCNNENAVYWLNSQLVNCAVFYAAQVTSFTGFIGDNTGFVGRHLINGCEFSGVQTEVQGGVQREEAITGRASLQQQATSPKLAKSKEIQST
ncbi:hypothetical protein [Klebsiella michiganensis]|uniref:hypothetical protein n=1 Tax=Klebsiella michiganensis TaxID=1134687 RepID=UPI0012B74349|nr:hypothetical protein [Klebsiella michiganensis]